MKENYQIRHFRYEMDTQGQMIASENCLVEQLHVRWDPAMPQRPLLTYAAQVAGALNERSLSTRIEMNADFEWSLDGRIEGMDDQGNVVERHYIAIPLERMHEARQAIVDARIIRKLNAVNDELGSGKYAEPRQCPSHRAMQEALHFASCIEKGKQMASVIQPAPVDSPQIGGQA